MSLFVARRDTCGKPVSCAARADATWGHRREVLGGVPGLAMALAGRYGPRGGRQGSFLKVASVTGSRPGAVEADACLSFVYRRRRIGLTVRAAISIRAEA